VGGTARGGGPGSAGVGGGGGGVWTYRRNYTPSVHKLHKI
jgi:hypothetical protein